MIKQYSKQSKFKLAAAAVLVCAILTAITSMFVGAVREQLWQQSIQTILESTQQGRNTLQVQLEEEFYALASLSGSLKRYTRTEEMDGLLQEYAKIDQGVSLYIDDGTTFPTVTQADEAVAQALAGNEADYGILDPHISSHTGVNVFDLFLRLTIADGRAAYLVKEYEVDSIVDSFSLSFYQNAGFSYVVDADGNVLIRPPHPNSNKTVQNLFDILRSSSNNQAILQQFIDALAETKSGWATFSYQGEQTVFCYLPLKLGSDWSLVSIIPQAVVNAQTNQIIQRTLLLITAILAGIALLVALFFRYANQSAKKLRRQADYIGHLYNAVPEGIALLTIGQPHRFLQLNREGLRLLDYPADASNDAPKGRLMEEVLYPEDHAQTLEIFRETVSLGKKNPFENRVVRADGSLFWAAGLVEKTQDGDGNDILIATFHDVTAEKLAEQQAEREKLQERGMLVAAISNVFPVIISLNLTQDTWRSIYIKPGLQVDLGEEGSYSQLYERFIPDIHPDSSEIFKQRFAPGSLRRTLGEGRSEVFQEARQLFHDGTYHWSSIQIIYVDNPYSDDQLAMLLSRCIDEQRYEEEQQRQALQSALEGARAASTAKTQFLSNMSHDIRTPMNAIIGMTAIASTHVNERERVLECLKKISLSGQHLLSLINDILDMSKIESGKLSLREEPFNFAELVNEITDLVRPQALAAQIELDVRLRNLTQETVIGDALHVRQVYLNILSNAVKYTRTGGSIQIEVWAEEGSRGARKNFFLRCADTGIGMPPAFLKNLFQPFERAQDSTSSKIAGTGLGMAITKNIVDLMNGDIQVQSEPGKGSVFTVMLPLQLQDTQQQTVAVRWLGAHSLIVDDDQQCCENAAELLGDMGLRAEFVTEGKAAVRKVIQAKDTPDPFTLVLIDWKMPEMDGVETARRIRQAVGAEVPVIILTAYDWAEIESEAREAGATAFLSKPFYRSKVCFLLNELDGEIQPQGQTLPDPARDYTGCRVLLVEDNDINREIARTLLEELGILVEEACDGTEAVGKVAETPEGYYDLVFMDVQMPTMNGYEATKAIRGSGRADTKTLPIVAMTANAFEEDVRAALRAGMDAHFAKPIEVHKLQMLLDRFLPKK